MSPRKWAPIMMRLTLIKKAQIKINQLYMEGLGTEDDVSPEEDVFCDESEKDE